MQLALQKNIHEKGEFPNGNENPFSEKNKPSISIPLN